jgi:hypothetical protein
MMIAIVVLATGLAGVGYMIGSAVTGNSRNKLDSSSTLMAQMVIEQIASQPVHGTATSFTIIDCASAPTTWTVNTTGASGGTGSPLNSSGYIDWTQSYASTPAGYKMLYVACGTAGNQVTYDIRWNIISLTPWTNMVTVSARHSAAGNNNALKAQLFAPPVTLRTIAGTK